MRTETIILRNKTLVDDIINDINKYISKITSEFKNPDVIEIVSIKIDLKHNRVYVRYKDYENEDKLAIKTIKLIEKIKKELESTKDELKKAILMYKLSQYYEDFYKNTGYDIISIMEEINKLKSEGKTPEEIEKELNIPKWLIKSILKLEDTTGK